MAATSYLIGLGSNRAHGRHGRPPGVVRAGAAAMATHGLVVPRLSPILQSRPLGPGGRDYANAAALVETMLLPPALLALLKAIEREFGRRPGRRWGARVLDLDILAWSGGGWARRGGAHPLLVPHPGLATRRFALDLAAAVAPRWRLPDGRSLAALAARLRAPRPVDRAPHAP